MIVDAPRFLIDTIGLLFILGGCLWKMGRDQGEVKAMLRAHCRDIGILMRHVGIDPPYAPGRDSKED